MKWFEYHQNNSGGSHIAPAINVHIEAESPMAANALAETVGLYWNGCDSGQDCPCCGDRWYELSEYDKGTDIPSHYGQPVIDPSPVAEDHFPVSSDRMYDEWAKDAGIPLHLLVYADGRRVKMGGAA